MATAIAALILVISLDSVPPLLVSAADATAPPPYTNHTVGGPAGWLFNSTTNTAAANYSTWAASQSYFLGDFLIFQTILNATVVQTYNATTYEQCSADDDGTLVFSGEGTEVAVALTEEGKQFYFSGDGDGIPCDQGMKFEINVAHGRGLPSSLAQPPPPPYVDPTTLTPPPASTTNPVGGTSNQNENFYNGAGGLKVGGARWLVPCGLGGLLLYFTM